MIFSLVLPFEMDILHFYDYLGNKGGCLTVYFAVYMSRHVTYTKDRES